MDGDEKWSYYPYVNKLLYERIHLNTMEKDMQYYPGWKTPRSLQNTNR
jgi:hypothetical protein